jgi:hypothetical protein
MTGTRRRIIPWQDRKQKKRDDFWRRIRRTHGPADRTRIADPKEPKTKRKKNPTTTTEAYWDLALVLGLVGGTIYLVYKGAQALGTAVGKSVGGATPGT